VHVSVIVRTRDEADRLRLTLASLEVQTHPCEIVVVDDGSTDHTRAVLSEAAKKMPLIAVHNTRAVGRPGASNAGARVATGDILLFLDGDNLADRDLIARHAGAHQGRQPVVARGDTFHLRCTRFLQDPEAGTPRPGEEARIAKTPASELARWCVTRHDIAHNFAGIARRAQPGIYPGFGPRRLYELEIDALKSHPNCKVLWAAASGANLSARRDIFLKVGGFNEAIDPNEHRELALRLVNAGASMRFVEGAKTFHMTHRSGWRDPLDDLSWETTFYKAHPIAAVRLLIVFWAGLNGNADADPSKLPIRSLPELEAMSELPDHVIEAARHYALSGRMTTDGTVLPMAAS
jgi:glycosyltransferase involved in cell wall biosynthesis